MPGPKPLAAAVSAAVAAMIVGLGCSPASPPPLSGGSQSLAGEQVLRVRLADAPRSLDPALAGDDRETGVVRQFSEPLLKPAADGQDVQPAAAESWTQSPDGLTLTFRLRSNARWSDGRPVVASDFVAAWRRLLDPRTAAPHADLFAAVVRGGEAAQSLDPKSDADRLPAALDALGLAAPADNTFVLTLPRPVGFARWVATLPEGGPWRSDGRPGAPANGPFRVAEAVPGHTTLAPNQYYWGGRPTLSALTISYSGDATASAREYAAGRLDILGDLRAPVPADVAGAVRVPELTTFWMDLNVERAPLDNARVRQAIAMSIDRRALIDTALAGLGQPATTPVPEGMRGYRPEAGRPQEYSPQAARDLLDASGVPRDQLVALPLVVSDRPLDRALAEAFAAQAGRNLGISFQVQPLGDAEFGKRVHAGDFAVAGPAGWTADYPDQANFYALFRSEDGNDWSRWRDQRYDGLVAAGAAETDPGRADALFNQALQELEAATPAVFLAQRVDAAAVRPYVKGLRSMPGEEFPGSVYCNLAYIAAH